ncbi:MAG: nuclear transport factor 2 family protein [Gemmatimonadaceae bacterium]|nr:nuclear transport factor 2 family protein [Gemmatimonadaceae bacterium]
MSTHLLLPMRRPLRTALLASLLLAAAVPVAAQTSGPAPTPAVQQEILALRERAWRTFFANDQAGFKEVVPAELVAIGWGGGGWADRATTLARMQENAARGQRIETLEFPQNLFQQYGDAVILYTQYRIVLKSAAGALSETRGRGTEFFVKRDGRWIHTGWHLDAEAP